MSTNTLVWGFDLECGNEIVHFISKDPLFNVRVWIGVKPEATHDAWDFFSLKESIYSDFIYDEKVYMSCYEKGLNTFINIFSRTSPDYSRTYHDLIDAFNILFRKMYELIIVNEIRLIIFASFPHEGPDYILYLIAKELKIKTILFYQSLFDNKFFIVNDLDGFGEFKNCQVLSEPQVHRIAKSHDTDYSYMKGVVALHDPSRKLTWRKCADWFFRKNYLQLGLQLTKYMRYRIFIYRSFHLSKDFNFDGKLKFVYFPLAFQPELSTSILGGVYNDQVLAIEKLANILPKNWVILVKENPKQTDMQRGEWFFKRLMNLKNVILVNPNTSTHLLIEKSEFVAAVAGTACWEAIKGGKKALAFGQPWYLSLPGVIQYRSNLTFDEINNYSFTHEQLEAEFSKLLSKAGEGVIDENYIAFYNRRDSFNPVVNAQSVLDCVKAVYKSMQFT